MAILGASPRESRYSHRAQRQLGELGYQTRPVNPAYQFVLNQACVPRLEDLHEPIDTVTLYIGPAHQAGLEAGLLALRPRRVIFNPGTENPRLAEVLTRAGIRCQNACTLVLLNTGQF